MATRAEWYALASISGVGPRRIRALLDTFGSLDEALAQPDDHLLGKAMLTEAHVTRLRKRLARVEEIERQLDDLDMDGIRLLTMETDEYPPALHTISRPPPIMFSAGDPFHAHSRGVAIVGARRASDEGMEFAHGLAVAVSEAGLSVISGLAAGIDSAAHEGCLGIGGTPVGVLGCGMGSSAASGELHGQVAAEGTLLTELKPGAPPTVANLMARNRLITALACAVVIVELGETQGTVSSMQMAEKQGRPMFIAAPAAESGPGEAALATGAPLIESADDVTTLVDVASHFVPVPMEDEDEGQLRLLV